MLAEHHAVRVGQDGEGAQVEHLVMQGAERQSVGFDVWPLGLEPLDVRGFQARRDVADAQVEAAHTATVLIGAQHAFAELRITAWRSLAIAVGGLSGAWRAQVQPNGRQDVAVQGFGKVGIQQLVGQLGKQGGVASQGGIHLGRKATGDVRRIMDNMVVASENAKEISQNAKAISGKINGFMQGNGDFDVSVSGELLYNTNTRFLVLA